MTLMIRFRRMGIRAGFVVVWKVGDVMLATMKNEYNKLSDKVLKR